MRALKTEKLELRQLAAVDLVPAGELTFLNEFGQGTSELASIGKFCTPVSVSLPHVFAKSPIIFEQTSTSTRSLDVDRDGYISPVDADLILQNIGGDRIIGPMQHREADGEIQPVQEYDVNSDGVVSPADLLAVVNRINFYNPLVPCNCGSCLAQAVVEGL